tara:strand:+ start:218 stop:532 length:315 start_codon:yes stop_codon:yes gene_type:complete
MKMNLPDILFVDCFFYGFHMTKQDLSRFIRLTPRGIVPFLPSKKRYLTVQPIQMQREHDDMQRQRDSKQLLSRSRSRMHSLDLLEDKSPTTPNENSEESNTKAT